MAKTEKKPEKKAKATRLPAQVTQAVKAANDKQALDLLVMDLRKADGFTDFFLICSGSNPRHVRAIADGIVESLTQTGVKPAHIEGYDHSDWILVDYFDFVVHVFSRDCRAFYGLERLWGSAQRIEFPDEPPAKP